MSQVIESFEHNGLSLRYISSGSGSHLVIAFHGFGRAPEEYLFITDYPGIRLLSIYLPGHPGSDEMVADTIDLAVWCQLMEKMIERYEAHRITVVGYSLGGRIAISTCMNWQIRNFRLLLLAPDGIQMHGLLRFAMRRSVFIRLFKGLLTYPNFLMRLTQILGQLRVLSKPTCHFFLRQLRDDSKRQIIKKVYSLFRHFIESEKMTHHFFDDLSHRLKIVLGQQDPIIRADMVFKLPKLIQENSVMIIEDAGHDLLSNPYVDQWKTFLIDTNSNE